MPTYDTIPTAPHGHAPHHSPPPSGGTTSGSSSASTTGGMNSASSSSSSSGGYDYAKEQKKAQNAAAKRLHEHAQHLSQQVAALKYALGKHGISQALNTSLANKLVVARQQDQVLMGTFAERVQGFKDTAEDNEKAAGAQTYANLTNRGRERANALSEAYSQGAGESDVLRAQGMSLRNWNANQNEVNRSFFDTQTSINSSITDLNADTKIGRANIYNQLNADREQLWTDYYGNRSEIYTQLGNVRGEMADDYSLANEQVGSKKDRGRAHHLSHLSGQNFMSAAHVSGQAYENPGIPKAIRQWGGAADVEGSLNSTWKGNTATEIQDKKPEGATLRSWT